ncbi:MAG: 23S rRNA (pseudouridine(1915)-N(3))-methyltransferase RlmH [Gammaproteobacteria bacterium]|nr:23S rRNA (pseudouridine(1915)-N(3))-methyltransferase RlmH [Gammaproteobacteria bacterium]MBT8151835.1 23S rRNA (pseudouridine(1915)-N(3))-methyltransferase RlmH [Gammaproteobacteria bacterium]NND39192.1 23S rRNA (pseudouridine(1915)-N(3))-methyltransferase RlmH [Pseudomonadales bacterium]NNM11702.1 23S rRNA (pseudouridine(1915)-N(3))-methyltransferase RlmH [Pseudomonadales bacterium]RZV53955.1 MAG: 23S rRNA (pseudouridine(1915)-N(3))-methyltransferase RlmH [Pseudomonadales bacterium]
MKIKVIAVGKKMPEWVYGCCDDYAQRLSGQVALTFKEVAMQRRGKSLSIEAAKKIESERLLQQLDATDHVVALCERGKQLDTRQFSGAFTQWREQGKDTSILIGGPDGIDFNVAHPAGKQWPNQRLSLSALTFPHPLVRVILAEQLYRAWSLASGHPYHRD